MAAKSKVKNYNPKSFYMIGDRIFHEKFEETGEVIEVGRTRDGVQKIIVDFEKSGRKRLVMDYKEA